MMTEDSHVKLKEYIERILDEREKALHLTATTLEKRLEHLNALRDDVIRDRHLFLEKSIFDAMRQADLRRMDVIEKTQAKMIGVGLALMVLSGMLGAVLSALIRGGL